MAFDETFNVNNGTGGRDDKGFSGQIASSNIQYDLDGWSDSNVKGAYQCLKFGTTSATGTCTTPEIVLVGSAKTATLTFNAAGWGSGTNTLTVSATGATLSGNTEIVLTNGVWTSYSITINATGSFFTLTFSGKRGFLDDVKVTEVVTAINTPTLTEEHFFWANTTETATEHVTLIPSDSTTVYYTTDGSEPTTTNGHVAMLTSNISITGTTTVKARAYYNTVPSSTISKTYTVGQTVNGIAAFKALTDGTEVRLYLADSDNARVLHGYNNNMYLRDNSGAICLDFGTTATFNPAPVHNQHVAGWVVGQKQTVNGLTKLVATSNTTTDFLALAAPVTEAATEPNSISAQELNNYLADWVTLTDLRVGDVSVTGAYVGALVDVSAIATANNQLAPVAYNDIKPIVYVIDEDQDFVSPANDVEHATIRLKRTLSKDYWNTFVVPFDITSFDGEIREYSSLVGNTMQFTKTDEMQAGIPYLVKPTESIVDPVYSDVTLSGAHATFVNKGGDYYFRGTYSPFDLSTDKRHMFITKGGQLAYPQDNDHRQLKGMRAYIEMLNGTPAPSFAIEGDATGITEVRDERIKVGDDIYDLQGRRVQNPGKGIYIVNGKKVFIQ